MIKSYIVLRIPWKISITLASGEFIDKLNDGGDHKKQTNEKDGS